VGVPKKPTRFFWVRTRVSEPWMSDDRKSWPILSAGKIGQQKSVVCRAKIGRFCLTIKSSDFIVQIERVLFLMIKSANFLDIGHHGDCLQWEMNIYFSYLFCLLLYLTNINFPTS